MDVNIQLQTTNQVDYIDYFKKSEKDLYNLKRR